MPFKTDFDAFMSECWQHHEENPEQVYDKLETALSEVEDVTQIERIFALMLHTAIGHLQCPEQFLTCLEHFDERKVAESLAFQRSIAVVRYFVDGTDNMELLEEQEQRRVYALISNELSALVQLELASQWLVKAALGMTPNDAEGPLARAIAITANNLACQYEALAERCEVICQQNGSDAFELFHAHDLLMQVHFHLSQKYKAKLDEEMQQHCKTSSLT
ncbi:TPA: hypothetical protein ACPHXL_000976 [Vibrio alginolyticus]|uniref:hypothetical protein n=1 Tax=Vibrio alginolyticus TaxID=663 RepID=UPI002277B2B6|nr:hypothetical protein [Vibrio alginolyticus]WAE59107.1 hypothetical protein OPR71_17660 [Vibrio alginolyticus]